MRAKSNVVRLPRKQAKNNKNKNNKNSKEQQSIALYHAACALTRITPRAPLKVYPQRSGEVVIEADDGNMGIACRIGPCVDRESTTVKVWSDHLCGDYEVEFWNGHDGPLVDAVAGVYMRVKVQP